MCQYLKQKFQTQREVPKSRSKGAVSIHRREYQTPLIFQGLGHTALEILCLLDGLPDLGIFISSASLALQHIA